MCQHPLVSQKYKNRHRAYSSIAEENADVARLTHINGVIQQQQQQQMEHAEEQTQQ
jgi:hypothetical protein